ncbi:MAG TPA: GAF domain-containing protein [Anaerolineae bacterium]|nr:GAF domain-containing protein [Anaerolineae bacterium]HQK13020.1 GAF domain-containing protein [Anaerolineae bacterium]
MTFKFENWPFVYKIMAVMTGLVLLALLLTLGVHTGVVYARMREQIGTQFAVLAEARMGYVVDTLAQQFTLLRGLALDPSVTEAVETSNARYGEDTAAIENTLLELDRQWLGASDDSELVQAIVNPDQNPLVAQLLAYVKTFPSHGEIFVTDRYGGLVAASRRTSDYYQADEIWWQAAFAGGKGALYVGQPAYDESIGSVAIPLAVPIYAATEPVVIGILRSTLDMGVIKQATEQLEAGVPFVTITDDRRVILADIDPMRVGQNVPTSWEMYKPGQAGTWFESPGSAGQRLLIGRATTADVFIEDRDIMAAIQKLGWRLFIYRPRSEAYAPLVRVIWTGVGEGIAVLFLAALAAFSVARSLARPIIYTLTAMQHWLGGDFTPRAWIYWHDETGKLAEASNTLADKLQELERTIAQRAAEREHEQRRRARDLNVAMAVGDLIAATADLQELNHKVVELLRERFGLYYVGLFLLDETGEWAVLHAGTGTVGQMRLAREYRVKVGTGLVGRCAVERTYRLVREGGPDSGLLEKSDLLYTRSAIALPLRSRGQIFGVIEVHSSQLEAFDTESVLVLQTIADQIAVAIDGLRLFAERQEAMESLQRAYGEASREAWMALLAGRTAAPEGYQAETRGLVALPAAPPEAWNEDARKAWLEGRAVVDVGEDGEAVLALPIRLRDEIIGVVDVSKRKEAGEWTRDEIAQLEELVQQLGLTLESSRFYQESQRAAVREQLLREISERVRVAVDVDSVMRIAAREIGEVLKRPVFVYLADEARSGNGHLSTESLIPNS